MKRFKCLRVQRHCGRRGSIYIIPCKLIYDAVTRQSLVSDIIILSAREIGNPIVRGHLRFLSQVILTYWIFTFDLYIQMY